MRREKNPHIGSSFDDYLWEEGIRDEVAALAVKRVLAPKVAAAMTAEGLTGTALARCLRRTSDRCMCRN